MRQTPKMEIRTDMKTLEGRRRAARADWAMMMPQASFPRAFLVVAALVVLEVAHVRTAQGFKLQGNTTFSVKRFMQNVK